MSLGFEQAGVKATGAAAIAVAVFAAVGCKTPACPAGTVRKSDVCQPGEGWETSAGDGAAPATSGTTGMMTLGATTPEGAGGAPTAANAGTPGVAGATAGTAASPVAAGSGVPGGAAGSTVTAGASASQQPATPMQEMCSSEGVQRCAMSGVGKRQVCSGGVWIDDAPCASGETCSGETGTAVCKPLNSLCNGRVGQRVCDAQGAMLACNADGTADVVETCMSSMLCTAGMSMGMCAMCVPGSSKCLGKDLLTCAPDGQSSSMMDCMSPALCQEAAGACMPPACKAGEFMCQGDSLVQCSADLTGFGSPKQCGPGLCDQQGKRCRNCMPGERRCTGDLAQMCDAQGQGFTAASCGLLTPHCTGEGMCVQCTSNLHCLPGTCETSACSGGTCMRTPAARGSKCSTGYCDGNRSCLTCLEDSHCGAQQKCVMSRCSTVDGLTWTGYPYSVTLRAGFSLSVSFNWGGTQDAATVRFSGVSCSSSTGSNNSCTISATSSDRTFSVSSTNSVSSSCTTARGSGNSVTLRFEDLNDGTMWSTDCGNPDVSLSAR